MKHTYMGGRDAADVKSGLPVDHSGPVVIQPTLSQAQGETLPPTLQNSSAVSPDYRKSGRGFGGGALKAERAGEARHRPGRTSLDSVESNCNSHPLRKGYCGNRTFRGTHRKTGAVRFVRHDCKTWDCKFCGPRKAARYRIGIRNQAVDRELTRLLTLTLDPKKIPAGVAPVRYLNEAFRKFRVYLRRRLGVTPQFMRVLEWQKNGNPHFHILIDHYVDKRWASHAWQAVGGGWAVDIRQVAIRRVAAYVSKYLSKDLLLSAPKGARRVTCSRGIHLFEKPESDSDWELLQSPISALFGAASPHVADVRHDEENRLSGFSVPHPTPVGEFSIKETEKCLKETDQNATSGLRSGMYST